MKRIVSVVMLLVMGLAFTACDNAEMSQSADPNATQTQSAAVTPTIEITNEITKKPVVIESPSVNITIAPEINDKNVKIEEIDELPSYDFSGWGWQLGMGNEDHLNSAILKILEHPFLYSGSFRDTNNGLRIISDDLRDLLKDHDVYLFSINESGPIYWDNYDENGNFYGGTSHKLFIKLGAGNKLATISGKRATFGYRFPSSTPTATPTAAPTPTVKPIVDYSKYNIQTVSKLIYTSEYGWELGMGNSDNLKKAIDEIVALDFEFLNEFDFAHDTEEEIQEKAIQSITHILEKYDVYVYYILISPGVLWSGYDENGNFISGESVRMNIALGAGNMIANVQS